MRCFGWLPHQASRNSSWLSYNSTPIFYVTPSAPGIDPLCVHSSMTQCTSLSQAVSIAGDYLSRTVTSRYVKLLPGEHTDKESISAGALSLSCSSEEGTYSLKLTNHLSDAYLDTESLSIVGPLTIVIEVAMNYPFMSVSGSVSISSVYVFKHAHLIFFSFSASFLAMSLLSMSPLYTIKVSYRYWILPWCFLRTRAATWPGAASPV